MEADKGHFVAPLSGSVDLISHVLSRLTFGARGPDYGRLAGLARAPEDAVHLYIEQQLAPERIDDSRLARPLRPLACLSDPLGELFEYKPKYLLHELPRTTVLHPDWSSPHLVQA